ncbi:MAG TPA: hypothetical protein PK727_04685 [Bacteroidales bacterium]|jgi:DNA-directed RNA polymerase subunit E'/Rpb7|nr:hypothetical protein [Bacteroidales bacterium]HOG56605.1 hypothetical protein [Bacteroidales bacterium]
MLIEEQIVKYDYDEKDKSSLIEKLASKYKLTEIRDWGSCIILESFSREIKAEILIGGNEIHYKVHYHG